MPGGYVHTATLTRNTPRDPNADGRDAEQPSRPEKDIPCRVGSPSISDRQIAAQLGDIVQFVCRMERDVSPKRGDVIVISGVSSMADAGEYEVIGIRPTPLDDRVLIRKTDV